MRTKSSQDSTCLHTVRTDGTQSLSHTHTHIHTQSYTHLCTRSWSWLRNYNTLTQQKVLLSLFFCSWNTVPTVSLPYTHTHTHTSTSAFSNDHNVSNKKGRLKMNKNPDWKWEQGVFLRLQRWTATGRLQQERQWWLQPPAGVDGPLCDAVNCQWMVEDGARLLLSYAVQLL